MSINKMQQFSLTTKIAKVYIFLFFINQIYFSDDDAYASGTMHTSSLSHRAMFSTWLESKINQFLMTLQHDLDAGAKKQSLDSILSQAMYFGQSLGRVGADFRPSLARILSRYLHNLTNT